MKVYICGAHAVGKSTLARYVSSKENIPIVPEAARMILSEQELQIDTLRCDLEVSNKYQQEVFNRQLSEEAKYHSFVSDRCAIDICAYSAQHSNILPALLNDPKTAAYIDSLKKPGIFIFFVRPSKATLRADGVREVLNWEGIIAIDAMIKFQFQMFNVKYFQINTDNMQERIEIIDNVLNLGLTEG